jgi:hypothetical protein
LILLRNFPLNICTSAIVIGLAGCRSLPAQVSYRAAPVVQAARPERPDSVAKPDAVPHRIIAVRFDSTLRSGNTDSGAMQSGSTQSGNTQSSNAPVSQESAPSGTSSVMRPGGAVVNLPVCAGSASVDDTALLMSIIRTSGMNSFYVSPEAPCYVHFTGQNMLPAGTKLMGTPGRSILRLFTSAAGTAAAQENLMYIGNSDITIEGLTLDANTPALDGYQHALIFAGNATNFTFRGNVVISSAPGGTRGIALWLYNGTAVVEANEFSQYETQVQLTADAGVGPKVIVSKNRFHDNNAAGGNAIYISAAGRSKTDIPALIEGNYISNISASSWSTGENGNAIAVYLANKVRIIGNEVESPRFSCFRSNSSDDIIVMGNHCNGAGETAAYSEFGAQHNQWMNNYIENAAGMCLDLTNYDQGGQYHTAIGNHMVRCGGAGIQAEANAIVMSNTIDQSTSGIVLGYGAYGKNVIAKDNLITDSSGNGITQFGIGIETGTAGAMEVDGNRIDLNRNAIVGTSFYQVVGGGALPATVTIRGQAIPFSGLGNPADGSMVYCPDCLAASPCQGGGTGALAKRVRGTWLCE